MEDASRPSSSSSPGQRGASTPCENAVFSSTSLTTSSFRRSCHLITDEIVAALGDKLKNTKVRRGSQFLREAVGLTLFWLRQIGILHLFIQHTSAALTINENCDPDVRSDMDRVLDKIVPVRPCFAVIVSLECSRN
jgi:hypothetical protein